MRYDQKRSLFGYHPDSVRLTIEAIKREHEQKINELKKELSQQIHQRELLRSEIDRVKKDVELRLGMKQQIAQSLVDAHLLGTNKVLQTMQAAEQTEKDLKAVIRQHQAELAKLQETMSRLESDLVGIADHYESLLEEKGGES